MTAADDTTRPPWLPQALYPFESHYADIDGARIHYIDEGSGPPLLLLHGTDDEICALAGSTMALKMLLRPP